VEKLYLLMCKTPPLLLLITDVTVQLLSSPQDY